MHPFVDSVCTRVAGLTLLLVLFFAWPSQAVGQQTSQKPLTLNFGVVPQQSATLLARLWTPLLNYLSEKTGYEFRFMTAPSIPTFEQRCAAGGYDIVYMNPYHYVVFSQSPGYRVFAREKRKVLKGIMVVRKDSYYQTLQELSGLTLAFPAPAAFAASMLPRAALAKSGIPFTPKFVASHDSVYRNVAAGLFAAGGGIERTFSNLDPEIREQLRVLWISQGYTPHAIAAHPRLSEAMVSRSLQALAEMDQEPLGKQVLEAIEFQGVVPATDAEYDSLRALNLHLLESVSNP